MSAADLRPGLFGKIPATGDFVTRRLPGDFVRFWDPFVARHLMPLVAAERWKASMRLNFLLGEVAPGPMAGIVLPSTDRVGRRFPLTIAAALRRAGTDIPVAAADWFTALHAAALRATEGELDGDGLAEQIAGLPFPLDGVAGAPLRGLMLWSRPAEAIEIDPHVPGPALERIFDLRREFG